MFHNTAGTTWLSVISNRVREREVRRQVVSERIRQAVVSGNFLESYVPGRVPALLLEFLKMVTGSILGFWILTELLTHTIHANPLYVLAAFGLIYSLQTTYYKYRLSADPDYKIPRCRCSGARNDHTEAVLQSPESATFGIPNSAFGVALYVTLLFLIYVKAPGAALLFALTAVLISAYLSYVMVIRIKSLCMKCINVAALNALILWQLLR
ncbi:MAG TPA: vitamin K epoxide reductase family protein [Candidatus Binataceae bacterium]|nr:vitamin K epoxide reductase family protein [Candidatus Binataceae bacterium]